MPKRLLLLALLAAAAGAFFAWPRINDVSTGKTPEYPDLQDKTYALGETRVAEGSEGGHREAARVDPEGRGQRVRAAGRSKPCKPPLASSTRSPCAWWPRAGRSVVKVRSRSRVGRIDLGQNARNIRELLVALDRELH